MPLSDLPREIILDIADQLDDAGMNALSHTNSQMYQLLNKYLYRRDITDVTRASSRSLTWAIENGVEATIQRAVDAAQHLDPISWKFNIALEDAAHRGDVNVVAALLKLDGINPNVGHRHKPLVVAVEQGHSAVVELLLAVSNINPNVTDITRGTPLLCACQGQDAFIVRQLLARDDIDLNTTIGWGTTPTPLLTAIATSNMEVINLLLCSDGIDVNFHPYFALAPIMVAIELGQMEVIESLLARDDLDLNIVDGNGDHLLLHSIGLGFDKVKLILDRTDIDPDFVGFDGHTALMLACSSIMAYSMDEEENLKLIEFLLNQNIDVNRRDNHGLTAFCYAAVRCNSKVITLLLDRDDINHNIPDANQRHPVFYAIERDFSVAELLVRKKGINVNARDNHGSTALSHACAIALDYHRWPSTDAIDFVDFLLSHPDTDPNIVDNNGVSVLSKVIELGRARGMDEYSQQIEYSLRAAGAR